MTKPCAKNRKPAAWLALNALDAKEATALRSHLETCAGCRSYLAEITQVAEQLSAAVPNSDLTASETFHRKMVARLEAEGATSIWERIAGSLKTIFFSRPKVSPVMFILPATGVLVVALTLPQWLASMAPAPRVTPLTPVSPSLAPSEVKALDLSPSLANYQRAVSESPDQLDALLSRQDQQTGHATPVCTAAANSIGF